MNFIQYIKQAWKAGTSGGTPLSPDRLNHMEDGIKNNNDMISELNNNINELLISYYKSETTLTLKKVLIGFLLIKRNIHKAAFGQLVVVNNL